MSEWQLEGNTKDRQSITADWKLLRQELIEGVVVKEISNVPKGNGYLTEVYRSEWRLDEDPVDQVFQVILNPGGLTAWHAHETTRDRLYISSGIVRIVLYDGRRDSETHGLVNEFLFGTIRPALIVIPPKVWHGVQNPGPQPATILNLVDEAYRYEDPDHWRLPVETDQVPYRWPQL